MVPTCLYYSCITLTKGTWQYASIYSVMRANARCQARDEENEDCDNDHDEDGDAIMSDPCNDTEVISYRRLYLLLDEASLTFNADPERGKHCASLCCSLLNVRDAISYNNTTPDYPADTRLVRGGNIRFHT